MTHPDGAAVPGEARIACPHAAVCPGCELIGQSYAEQLRTKGERLRGELEAYPELARAPIGPIVPADALTGYRERAKLAVDGGKIGLFARGTHEVVDLPFCRVIHPDLAETLAAVRHALDGDHPASGLDARHTDGGTLLTLIVDASAKEKDVTPFVERVLERVPNVLGLALSRRAPKSPQLLGSAPSVVSGPSRVRTRLFDEGPYHYATHGAFAQAHRGQQRALAEAVIAAAVQKKRGSKPVEVLELFAGSGALALELAARGAKVLAVESFEPASRLTRDAAAEQGLLLEVESGDASEAVQRLRELGRRFDVVVVNPPRRGISPRLRADLAELLPRLLAYVSCEPATLARDLSDWVRKGLYPESLSPYDMMPLTGEVETLALVTPDELPPAEVIYRDAHLVAVVKAPHEPTTPQGEHAGSLLDRVRRIGGTERATPVHRLDVGTSGIVLFAIAPEFVPALSRALTDGDKEYVALARGVVRDKGSIRRPLVERGRPLEARTRYTREQIVGGHSFLTVRPDEGRKHQIRRHLAAIGHAVVGDERYGHGPTNTHFSARHYLDRPFLHCAKIAIVHQGSPLELNAPLAPDLGAVLRSLRASGASTEG